MALRSKKAGAGGTGREVEEVKPAEVSERELRRREEYVRYLIEEGLGDLIPAIGSAKVRRARAIERGEEPVPSRKAEAKRLRYEAFDALDLADVKKRLERAAELEKPKEATQRKRKEFDWSKLKIEK